LAAVQLDTAVPGDFPEIGTAVPGSLLVVLGTDIDASPTVRLTVVHRFLRTADGPSAVLDLAPRSLDPGSLVLDAHGRLIGMAATASDEIIAIPCAAIERMMHPSLSGEASIAPARGGASAIRGLSNRRGWLGISLQPITVPDQLLARTGQTSGRMIVNVTTGGPADRAGIRVGDVVLSLNGDSLTGQNGLRAFLARERIGSEVEIKLLRDGNMVTTHLVVAAQP
jgi:S1-C subfamily serine protease